MEQKQTLWIIASSGMFLLVVLGAAYILFSSDKNPQKLSQNISQPQALVQPYNNDGWTTENIESNNDYQLPPPVIPGEITTDVLTVFADNTVVYNMNPPVTEENKSTTIDLNTLKNDHETQPQNINITVNIPETRQQIELVQRDFVKEEQNVKKVTTPEKEPESIREPVEKPASKQNLKTAPAVKPVPSPAPRPTPVPTIKSAVSKPTPAPKAAEKTPDRYWVQAASYSTKKAAEDARSSLDANKIQADIFTYQDAKGKVYYRVRVGPYTTKSEAEYWKAKIMKISDFAKSESYITVN